MQTGDTGAIPVGLHQYSRPWSSEQDASSPSRRSRGRNPLAAPKSRRRVGQKQTGLLIRGKPWSVTTRADQSGGRRRRVEPSGRDPDPSRCDSGRSPQKEEAEEKRTGLRERQRPACLGCRKCGVQVAGARPIRPRRSTADRFHDMEETEVRLLSRAPGRCRTTAVRSLGKTEMRVRLPSSAPEPSPLWAGDAEKKREEKKESGRDADRQVAAPGC